MEYLTLKIDLIEEIRKAINNNPHFDVNKWCHSDAEALRRAANVIDMAIREGIEGGKMNKELVEKLAGWLHRFTHSWWEGNYNAAAENVLTLIEIEGYVIVKKDELIKEAEVVTKKKGGDE